MMKNMQDFHALTEDKLVLKKKIKDGEGDFAKDNQEVEVHYTGKFENGDIFDSTKDRGTFKFLLGANRVIKGWEIGVKTMCKGEQAEFIIYPGYAYGEKGFPPKIAANSTLIFEVELVNIYEKIKTKWEMDVKEKIEQSAKIKEEGVTLFKEKKYFEASAKFEEGLSYLENLGSNENTDETNDKRLILLLNWSNSLNNLKEYKSTIKKIEKALKIKEHPKCYYYRGMAYLYLDEFENSENDFKKLANLLPNDPTSKNCFDLLQQRKIEKQKKEQKLFKSFLHSKLYEEKDDKHITLTTPAKSIPKDINSSNPKVFFELKNLENDIKSYRVEFELFQDKVPKTTENFISFCRGYVSSDNKTLSYKGTKFHRVIKDFMMQGGDFENGNGTGGCSIYGKKFDDENFFYPHSQELLLSMANSGPNTNGSQFFITFKETPWLDGKHVVFGRVIKGGEFIKELEKVSCGENNIPNKDIIIVDCGDVIN